MTSQTSLTSVQVGDDVSGGLANGSASGAVTSSDANPSIAYGVTKVVNAGRNGRWFLPGVPEEVTSNDGSLPANQRASLQTQMDQFLADCEAGGVDLRVKQKDGTYAQVDSFSVRPFTTLQSRRFDRTRGF